MPNKYRMVAGQGMDEQYPFPLPICLSDIYELSD